MAGPLSPTTAKAIEQFLDDGISKAAKVSVDEMEILFSNACDEKCQSTHSCFHIHLQSMYQQPSCYVQVALFFHRFLYRTKRIWYSIENKDMEQFVLSTANT